MRAGVCLFFVYVGMSSSAWAETSASKSVRDLAKVQAKIKQLGGDVKKLAAEKSELMEDLRRLEKQYGEQINSLNEIKLEIDQQEQMLQEVKDKIDITQQSLQAQRRSLEGVVKAAYVMGDKQGLDVLLNQRDPAFSGRMLVYFNYISKARIQKLRSIEENVQTLKRLESQKDTEAQLLQISLGKKQQETDALQGLKAQREHLLARLNNEYASKQSQLASLIEDEKKLEALVASLQSANETPRQSQPAKPESKAHEKAESPRQMKDDSQTKEMSVVSKREVTVQKRKHLDEQRPSVQIGKAFAELQGKLPWPVSGAIVEHFGNRRFETRWDGAVIVAREGSDIHVVADGRVVFADWLRGYGLMTIVDHGKGYMSLYAFNQSLHKKVGEYVRAGETLASVGRSGGRSRASLYFGIRIKGRAVDPEKWCRKLSKG